MGRKIRGKKHRGVKDPYEQQKRREEKKKKANLPPQLIVDQEEPRKLREMIELSQRVKLIKKKRGGRKVNKKKSDNPDLIDTSKFTSHEKTLPGMKKYWRPCPVFKQRVGEGDNAFVSRVSRECNTLVKQTKFEDKYGVEIHEDQETGAVELVKRKKDEVDEIIEKSNPKKKKKLEEIAKRKQLKKERFKAKKRRRDNDAFDDFEPLKDEVKFGEVVHAPPQNLARPRRTAEIELRPGRKPLLLKSMMVAAQEKKRVSVFDKPTFQSKKKVKTQMTVGEKRILEADRQRVVEAYRLMKAKQSNKYQISSS